MRVSMKDVARAAKVSQSAVSRVINNNGYISEEKRQRILQTIRDMGYLPNALARGLVQNKSGTIGLCLPYLNTPFISSLMEGIDEESEKAGYEVFICHTKESGAQEKKAIARMLERQVEGMIIVPALGRSDHLSKLTEIVPTLFLLRKPVDVTTNLICAADYEAAKKPLAFLLGFGHRHIGFLRGPSEVSTISERWRGIQDLLEQEGVPLDSHAVFDTPFEYQKSYGAARKLLEMPNRPTGFYSLHYWGAAAFLKAANDMGLRIPDDISLVSYESFEEWNYMNSVAIATNLFPARKMGSVAMNSLKELIENNRTRIQRNIVIEQTFYSHPSVKRI